MAAAFAAFMQIKRFTYSIEKESEEQNEHENKYKTLIKRYRKIRRIRKKRQRRYHETEFFKG
ncbi:hypothetical protein Bbad01_30860 [Bacillus badius]|nr:hypothetical protein Bbad01_30860 [Bacillus badius]